MLSTVTSCDHSKDKIAFNHVLVNKYWNIVSSLKGIQCKKDIGKLK